TSATYIYTLSLHDALPIFVRAPDRRDVRALRVRRQVEDVRVATRAEHYRVGNVRLDAPRQHVARHDAARHAVDDDEVEHLVTRVHLHLARGDLSHERLVGAEQELLAGLSACVERAGDLRAAEAAVRQVAAVLAGERHALRHALVDDVQADLGQPVDVGLAGTKVTALHRIVEEAVDA